MCCTPTTDARNRDDLPTFSFLQDTPDLPLSQLEYDTLDKEKGQAKVELYAVSVRDAESNSVAPAEADFPDGGLRAWLVVVGVVCNLFSTIGYANTWGAFQSYYQRVLLKDSSYSSLAWIGSIQYALMFMPALFTGRLFDLGYFHSIALPASVIQIAATFLVAECTQFWHFLLCQGILIGLAAGCTFSFTAPILAHWFHKRRGLVMALWAVGAALGGTILPICARFLISSIGFRWAMRTFGFIFLVTLGLSNLLMRRRLPPKEVTGGLVDVQAFRYIPYLTYCLSAFISFLGFYTPLTFIAVSATSLGVSQESALYFVTFANGASLVGRLFAGFASSRLGTWNVIIPATMLLAASICTWPFMHTEILLVVVTIVYGFTTGIYIAMMNNPIVAMGDTADVGRRVGMFFTIVALGAIAGPPISGTLAVGPGGFVAVGFYAGSCVLHSAVLMVISRHFLQKAAPSGIDSSHCQNS